MLYNFKKFIEVENRIFIIGYSVRDPIISSLLEDVIARRIRNRHISPLSSDIWDRATQAEEYNLKIVIIDSDPESIAKNLERQKCTNLLSTFVPVKIEFPKISDGDFKKTYAQELTTLVKTLDLVGVTVALLERNRIARDCRAVEVVGEPLLVGVEVVEPRRLHPEDHHLCAARSEALQFADDPLPALVY